MNTGRTGLRRVFALCLYAAAAVRTAWINAAMASDVDGTPIMSFAVLVLCPLSLLALVLLAFDVKSLVQGRVHDCRIWAAIACEVVGVGATLSMMVGLEAFVAVPAPYVAECAEVQVMPRWAGTEPVRRFRAKPGTMLKLERRGAPRVAYSLTVPVGATIGLTSPSNEYKGEERSGVREQTRVRFDEQSSVVHCLADPTEPSPALEAGP